MADFYDKNGRLTREGMLAAVASGGSFGFNGKIIANPSAIPSEDELAETPDQIRVADADIDAEIAALQARKAKLANKTPPTSVADDEPKFAGHPLSYFAGKSDEEIEEVEGVGPKTFQDIKAALAARK